jgi:hypothetical protein
MDNVQNCDSYIDYVCLIMYNLSEFSYNFFRLHAALFGISSSLCFIYMQYIYYIYTTCFSLLGYLEI